LSVPVYGQPVIATDAAAEASADAAGAVDAAADAAGSVDAAADGAAEGAGDADELQAANSMPVTASKAAPRRNPSLMTPPQRSRPAR
jgi:hypothetical protein